MKRIKSEASSTTRKPLKLSRETLKVLTEDELVVVAGGRSMGCYASCLKLEG